ncbi:lmo0937 family membrane protein [Mucilaginibacter gilvus]|uniref:Lmo0937 family membrane protein n=1 Tax=Mucilaginibacter gilvus TaxID=2305909 RepID=A0A3S3XF11_9SPHI|nr:lmo0937 family membrane protein [Mucilaginibacter gilvus]RWY57023.1 lmo0937 family membrane protein [Mucilaginibacter gilvus]
MRSLLYIIAVILVIIWIFGAFVSPFGGNIIHVLLVIAIIALILGVIRRA